MELRKSLELVYEIEGLLQLLSNDEISEEKRRNIEGMLHEKFNVLADAYAPNCEEIEQVTAPEAEIVAAAAAPVVAAAAPVVEFVDELDSEETPTEPEQCEAEQESEVAEAAETTEEPATEETIAETSTVDTPTNISAPESEVVEEIEESDDVAADDVFVFEDDDIEENNIQASAITNDLNESTYMKIVGSEFSKVFTLNDKFRFRRELFGNSEYEFNDAVNLVGAMQSPTEAEEYFYDQLGWDPENEEVKAFMHIVNAYLINR